MDVRMGSRSRRVWRNRSSIFGRMRGGIGNLNRIRNLHGYLDVLLADVLNSCMALFFIKGLLDELVVSMTLLFFCGCALFFRDVVVGHIASLVDQGLALVDDFGSVPRHSDRVAFDFHSLFTLLSRSCLKSSCLTFFQVV